MTDVCSSEHSPGIRLGLLNLLEDHPTASLFAPKLNFVVETVTGGEGGSEASKTQGPRASLLHLIFAT